MAEELYGLGSNQRYRHDLDPARGWAALPPVAIQMRDAWIPFAGRLLQVTDLQTGADSNRSMSVRVKMLSGPVRWLTMFLEVFGDVVPKDPLLKLSFLDSPDSRDPCLTLVKSVLTSHGVMAQAQEFAVVEDLYFLTYSPIIADKNLLSSAAPVKEPAHAPGRLLLLD